MDARQQGRAWLRDCAFPPHVTVKAAPVAHRKRLATMFPRVMAGLVPAIHAGTPAPMLQEARSGAAWMPGARPGMTDERLRTKKTYPHSSMPPLSCARLVTLGGVVVARRRGGVGQASVGLLWRMWAGRRSGFPVQSGASNLWRQRRRARIKLGLNVPSGLAAGTSEKEAAPGGRRHRKTAGHKSPAALKRALVWRVRPSGGKEAVLSGAVSGSEVTPSGKGARA